MLYFDVLFLTGWGTAVARAICIWIFIVVLRSPSKQMTGKVQYAYLHIAITSSFQILHNLLLSYLI